MASRVSLLRSSGSSLPYSALASSSRRPFASSLARPAAADADEDADSKPDDGRRTWLGIKNDGLKAWFRSEEGEKFKWPKAGQHNWIGGDRDEIYACYKEFPVDVTAVQRVNLLSEKYNIGKDRITALVKTGQVGETWEKLGLAPQNAFVRGMEDFLVVPKHKAGNSDAQRAFKDYLGSRIDIERDLEGARLARGELEVRLEDDGYGQARNSGKRLGALSWEFAAEGQTPLSTKMQLEKPLRPPPALPEFPSKLIGGGDSKAVDHVVDVGNKFRGQGWDGKINYEFYNKASGQGYPGHRNPIRKFVPVLTRQIKEANGIVTKTRNEKTAERRARRAALNAEGVLTPTQEILAKSMPGGVYDPTFVGKAEFHRRVFVAKLAAREKRVVKTRLRRRADMADAKAEFQQMVKDRINGKI